MSAAAQVLRQAEALKASISDSAKGISETWVARQRLEDLYKKLLLMDLEYALDKKVEQELWNHAFKNHINELQSQTKDKQNVKRGEVQATLNLFLETASGFYLQLLQLICTTFKLDLPFRRKSSCFGVMKEKIPTKIKITPPKKSSCLYFCQHCLVHLGDIARYRQQIEQAQTYYWHAANLVPFNGQPYNQLAIVEAARGNKLSTVFYYIRSLAVRHPFPVAATNLEKLYTKISRDMCDFKGKLSVSEMITAFLQFQAYVHLCNDLDKASFLSEKLLQALPAHVTSQSFPSHILVQIVAINIFAMQHARQIDGENDDYTAEQLTSDEERAFELMLLFTISILDVLLQYTPKHDHKLREFFTLPSVKLLLDWFRLNPVHLSNPIVKISGLWINLCKVLNNIKPPQTKKDEPIDLTKYEELPLPEDTELRCFQPLEKAHSCYSYSRLPSDGLPQDIECHLRCQRILNHGRWVAEEHSNLNLLVIQNIKALHLQFSSPVIPNKSLISLNRIISSSSPEKKSRQNVAIQAIIQKQTKGKDETIKPSKSEEKIKIVTTTIDKSVESQLGPASPKYLLGTPTNQPEFMKTTASTKPANPNIPPRLQQQPPRLQKQLLAQQQARQLSQEKQLWEPDKDSPKPSSSNTSFEVVRQSSSGSSLWEPENTSQKWESDNDMTWKPQQPSVGYAETDPSQRKHASQPPKLWEPKTGKFKIVESNESQRSSNMHAWASPQQEVSQSMSTPSFPPPSGQATERQAAPQQQGQTGQPFNQFMMFRPDFRQPPPNLPPPPPGPPGQLQRMMGYPQPPTQTERSNKGEDPLMSLRGPPGKAAGSNIPLGRPPPNMESFPPPGKMGLQPNFPPPGNINQNQGQDNQLDVGPSSKTDNNPHSKFLNFTNFPPPPPPMAGQQYGGKENPMMYPNQQGINFPRFAGNQPPKEVYGNGTEPLDMLNKHSSDQPNQQFPKNLYNFPPAPGRERMNHPSGPNIHQPPPHQHPTGTQQPPNQHPHGAQPPPNFNMLNPNFLSSGRFPVPRAGFTPQTETHKMMNGDIQGNVSTLSHLAIQPPKSGADLFPVSPRMSASFQGHAEGTPKPDSGNSPSRSPLQPAIEVDVPIIQTKPIVTTSAPVQQGTYSLFSGTTWSVPLSSADTKSIGSSPFSSESSSIRNSPDVSESFSDTKIGHPMDLGLRFGTQEDHWRELAQGQGQVLEQMASNGQGGNFFQGNMQSIWSSSSSGPSPLERLLEKQKQRQNDPH
ncbi:EST1C [Mytilus edulis]|uniref:SMG7 n=1 Tax=Mytilus edulis TaxID=6550 RepID=A0A8S3SWL3_MYTED|nr:EST1C [Mytilus edulis]